MRREDAVGVVRREGARRESLRRLTAELAERDVGVVDPVAPTNGLLVIESIREAQPRTPGILGDVLELALSRAPGPSPAKMTAPGMPPAPGFGVVGLKVEHLVGGFGPGRLIVEAQTGVSVSLLETLNSSLTNRPVRLPERWEHRDGLIRRVDLSQQEGRKRIAGLGQVVPGSSNPAVPRRSKLKLPAVPPPPSRGPGSCDGGTRIRLLIV